MNFDRIASGNRFEGIGLKTNAAPDAMPPKRSPYILNLREFIGGQLSSRPQLAQTTAAPTGLTDVVSLEANLGVANIGGSICVGGTAVDSGYSPTGSSLIPFRPNASPQAYEYVFDANKSTKIGPSNSVQNIGIVEPQSPCDVYVQPANYYNDFTPGGASDFTSAGAAGAVSAGGPASITVASVFFLSSAGIIPEVIEQYITLNTPGLDLRPNMGIVIDTETSFVSDIYPPFSSAINIAGIQYYSGTTGKCVVVPANVGIGPGQGSSIYDPRFMQTIRRGAIIQIGSEVCQILGTAVGPDGTVSFETSTTSNHTTSDTITAPLATLKTRWTNAASGQTVTAPPYYSSTITAPGIGTISAPLASSPFVIGGFSFQPDDYIHIGLNIEDFSLLEEIKIIFDVNNGSATYDTNAYFYSIRPNDIQEGIDNTLVQLGVAQIVQQRSLIDEEQAAETNNQATTVSSAQTSPGDKAWSEIIFPISALTRIGNDQTRTLANVQGVQILVNSIGNGNFTLYFASISVFGGGQIDVKSTGIPLKYRIRPRSSVTGAKGNPSPEMRYEVTCRRDNASVALPTTYPDPQVDTWDIFRQGGALENYTFVGTVPLSAGYFIDQFNDAALEADEILETGLYQPFPTIDYPFSGTANIVGTSCVVTIGSSNPAANVLRYLPGNVVTVGQQNYTLRYRPTQISTGVYFFDFVENAGVYASAPVYIYEPLMAQQNLPYVWGPDANGRLFGAGDTYRPGFIYTTNPNDPDSCDDNADEVCPPTEPIQNGALLGGTSLAASVNRWWRGFPQQDGSYNWKEVEVGASLEFPWAITGDGKAVYFVGKDGLYMTSGGPAQSLTDADLYNLFPHEDVYPETVVYNGQTIYPPAYQYGIYFRLTQINGYLFFEYRDAENYSRTLILNLKTGCWYIDSYFDPVTVRSSITSPPSVSGGNPQQQMYCGTRTGAVYQEVSNPVANSGESIEWAVATAEEMAGDLRAPKLWGDASLDILPLGNGIQVTPMFLGVPFSTPTVIAMSTRTQAVINLAGGQYARSMGLYIQGTDQGVNSTVYIWQPSYIVKPEFIEQRFEDWNDSGVPGNKFYQGFILEANTESAVVTATVRDSDTLQTHPFTGPTLSAGQMKHDGQSIVPYSFNTPFRAHSVRLEPTGSTPWQKFSLQYVFEPSPEFALTWSCQPVGWGIDGYKHIQRCLFAYCSTASVTLSVNVDGRSYSFTLPSTAGVYAKKEIIFNPLMKGLIYTLSGVSTALWAVWPEDSEILVKQWGDPGPYQRLRLIGTQQGAEAKI